MYWIENERCYHKSCKPNSNSPNGQTGEPRTHTQQLHLGSKVGRKSQLLIPLQPATSRRGRTTLTHQPLCHTTLFFIRRPLFIHCNRGQPKTKYSPKNIFNKATRSCWTVEGRLKYLHKWGVCRFKVDWIQLSKIVKCLQETKEVDDSEKLKKQSDDEGRHLLQDLSFSSHQSLFPF